jgi:hypothetical protein
MLAIVVEKSRKCLDFGTTVYLYHLLFCAIFDGFPATYGWWITHSVCAVVMVVLGEYLCSLREMQDIPLLAL